MINPLEQDLLRRLTRDYYSGAGVIIDAGIFLGASTNVFASSLRERRDLDHLQRKGIKPVQSYDLGICDDYMAKLVNDHYQANLKAGDSFLPYLRKNIAGTLDLVRFYEGDICQYSLGEACEIVFLDVCKRPDVNQHTVRAFYSRLIPGQSVLIHQDFVHDWLPWIHVTMGALAPYFEFIGTVTWSAVWLNTKPIPAVALNASHYESASVAELNAFFDRATAPLKKPLQRVFFEQARARMLAEKGAKSDALILLDRIETEWRALKKVANSESYLLEWTDPAATRRSLS
jgi:hypothetical protein